MKTNQKLAKYLQQLDEQDLRTILHMVQLRNDRYLCLDGSMRSNLMEKPKNMWSQLPLLVRMGLVHSFITLVILSQYPPAPQLPPILLPITWAASFAVTVTLFGVVFPRPVQAR